VSMLLLFVLALIPRALAHSDIVTVDEAYHWFDRVETFLGYIEQGDYASTNIVGHPGVTTLWLGAAGVLTHRYLAAAGWIAPEIADPALYRAIVRLPIAIVAALCVALAYPLMRRLFGGRVALLAALLWAGEPFLIAHAQLLHLDALLTSFVVLALLLALFAFAFDMEGSNICQEQCHTVVRWRYLAASGLVAGLAFLTKSPSVILLPMMGCIAMVAWLHRNMAQRHSGLSRVGQSLSPSDAAEALSPNPSPKMGEGLRTPSPLMTLIVKSDTWDRCPGSPHPKPLSQSGRGASDSRAPPLLP